MRKLSGTRFDSRPLARGRVSIEPVAGRSARLRRHLLVCQGRSERKRRDRCVTRTEEDDDQVPTANGAGPQPESTIRGRGDPRLPRRGGDRRSVRCGEPGGRDRPNLQKDLDALVAAGAPGAVLLVRNQNHTVRYRRGSPTSQTSDRCALSTDSGSQASPRPIPRPLSCSSSRKEGFTSTTASNSTCRGSSRTAARSRSASCSTTRAGCLTTSTTRTS